MLDSLEFGHRASVPGVPLVEADIADSDAVTQTVKEHEVDAVVHFAAYKAAGESMEVPQRYFANNVAKSIAMLELLEKCGVERFVFSSSCSVYGTPTVLPVDENHPLAPESPYAESKRLVERVLDWYGRCRGMRAVSLRYFNAAGATPDGDFGEDWRVALNLVPIVMKAAVGRAPDVKIFGTDYDTPDGTAIRDYVHVADLADAHVKAIELLERGGASDVVNLGTGKGSSVLEVVEPRAGSVGGRSRSTRWPGVQVTRLLSTRTTGRPQRCWVGDRATGSTRSSSRPGAGTRPTPTVTGAQQGAEQPATAQPRGIRVASSGSRRPSSQSARWWRRPTDR